MFLFVLALGPKTMSCRFGSRPESDLPTVSDGIIEWNRGVDRVEGGTAVEWGRGKDECGGAGMGTGKSE